MIKSNNTTEPLSRNKALAVFAQEEVKEVFSLKEPYLHQLQIIPTRDEVRVNLIQNKKFDLKFKGLSVAGNLDLGYSLAYHTTTGQCQIINSAETNDGWNITSNNFTFSIFDRYDWDFTHGGGTGPGIFSAIQEVLINLGIDDPNQFIIDNLGEKVSDELQYNYTIDDGEGKLLVEKGYAKEFDIFTDPIRLTDNIDFFIPRKTLKNPEV